MPFISDPDKYSRLIWVSLSNQQLTLYHFGKPVKKYRVSTAKKGAGNRAGSMQTPLGWHKISAKIGARAAKDTVFKDRVNTGIRWDGESQFGDLILTRILWLDGMEKGINKGGRVDTGKRYIYIHGTNHVKTLGKPASHGCVTMSSRDVADLFRRVKKGDPVVIA
jgi:L,D-transpeptidase YbiS